MRAFQHHTLIRDILKYINIHFSRLEKNQQQQQKRIFILALNAMDHLICTNRSIIGKYRWVYHRFKEHSLPLLLLNFYYIFGNECFHFASLCSDTLCLQRWFSLKYTIVKNIPLDGKKMYMRYGFPWLLILKSI